MNVKEIQNKVVDQMEHGANPCFPLDVFPVMIQSLLLLKLEQVENFNLEFCAAALLSAVATAIGNSYHILIKGGWHVGASFYLIFVGRPGIGKTPPLHFAYAPLLGMDKTFLKQYMQEMEAYQATAGKDAGNNGVLCRPVLKRFVVADITPEAMMKALNDNPRGICMYVDEILGLFNSLNQYNHGQFLEQLLTGFSGEPLNVTRCNNPILLYIHNPCINIVGTIQTTLVPQLFRRGLKNNGFLDRVLFVYPRNLKIAHWNKDDLLPDMDLTQSEYLRKEWGSLMQRIASLQGRQDADDSSSFVLLRFTEEARSRFYAWRNADVDGINAIEDESLIDSRVAKFPLIAARLALCIQLLKWACGEGTKDCVDLSSVESAIQLMGYFNDSYHRLMDSIKEDDTPKSMVTAIRLYEELPDSFTTGEAVRIAKSIGIHERTAKEALKILLDSGKLMKLAHGSYRKTTSTEIVHGE